MILQRIQREQRQRRAVFFGEFHVPLLDDVIATGGDILLLSFVPNDEALIAGPLRAGYTIERYINVAERDGERRLAVTYRKDGKRLEVRTYAEWFGDLPLALVPRAWARLREDLQFHFGPHAVLLSSLAQTGQDLLERSLPRHRLADRTWQNYTFPSPDEDTCTWLYKTQGQGRLELFPHEYTLGDLYGLDGVWMYASCLSNLPTGPLTSDRKDTPPGDAVGFLTASVRVPDGWAHIGLLPEQYTTDDGETHRRYPRTPGTWFASAMTTSEYQLAVANGWDVRIKQRQLYQAPTCDPARSWHDKLVNLRQEYEDAAGRGDIVAGALAGTVRRLMLNTIGLWFSHEATTDSYIRRDELPALLEAHPDAHVSIRGKHWAYVRLPRVLDEAKPWQHPEWAATVWGRARRRLAQAALTLPYESIVSLRTDAIWSTLDPHWPESSKPGTFRLKEFIEGPSEPPVSDSDMRLLMTRARRV